MGAASPPVVLTRATADNQMLRHHLQAAGVQVIEIATAAVRPLPVEPDRAAVQRWAQLADALAFSSRHGVAGWLHQFGAASVLRPGLRLAAVGEATAAALVDSGALVYVQAREPATGKSLARALRNVLPTGALVLVVQARVAQGDLTTDLLAGGFDVRQAVVYENCAPADPDPALHAHACAKTIVFAAAPSAVVRLLDWSPAWRLARWVAIGPTTAKALQNAGLHASAISSSTDVAACAAAILHTIASPLDPP